MRHRLSRAGDRQLNRSLHAFLAALTNRNATCAYTAALGALVDDLGTDMSLSVLDDETTVTRIATWFAHRWGAAAPSTANARFDALSAAAWWRDQGCIHTDPLRRIRRRQPASDHTARSPAAT